MLNGVVQVAIPVPLRRLFHYRVPPNLAGSIVPGSRVMVPFGRRSLVGYVVDIDATPPPEIKLRFIKSLVDKTPTFSSEMLVFLRWVADYYHAPIGEVLRGAHPAGTNQKSVPGVRLGPSSLLAEAAAVDDLNLKALLVAFAEHGGPLPTRGLPGSPSEFELRAWIDQGFIERCPVTTKARVTTKTVAAYRAIAAAPLQANRSLKRDRIHSWLVGKKAVIKAEISAEFGRVDSHLKTLVGEGAIVKESVEVYRDPFFSKRVAPDIPPQLNRAQESCVSRVLQTQGYQGFLLWGITGSGKTEVYLRIIEAKRKMGLGALVLLPEIALTPQLVHRFRGRFGDEIAVLHSGLSDGARFDQWRQIKRGQLNIVVGARSAVFAPVKDLGVIVVDEEHDPSFKQGEGVRYNARDMALVRGSQEGVPVILGSATPSLESIHNTQQGKLERLVLPERATGGRLPNVEMIDLRIKTSPSNGSRFLSGPVKQAIAETLERGEQTIVFLNRRGFSSFVQCTDCGEGIYCHQCAISMTWHKRRGLLHCHYCDAVRPMPQRCPKCDSPSLELFGRGTERIEDILQDLYPQARVQRLDRDTSAGRGLERTLEGMRNREIDILVGTQMVTKGHDFPFVTLVCVLDADAGLRFPDFRSAERTFQLLTQVAGRAGRADRAGRVLVQSWEPEQSALQCLTSHDHAQFSQNELSLRQALGYPPFTHAAAIRVDGRDASVAERYIKWVAHLINEARIPGLRMRGPAPAALEKIRNRSRWALLITAADRATLRGALSHLPWDDKDRPSDLRLVLDVDPYDLL